MSASYSLPWPWQLGWESSNSLTVAWRWVFLRRTRGISQHKFNIVICVVQQICDIIWYNVKIKQIDTCWYTLIHIDTYWYILIHTDTYWYEYNHLISLAITCDNQIYLSKWDQVLWSWASSDHERNNLCMFQKKHNMFGKQRASPNRNEKMGMRPSSAGQSSPLSKSIPVFRILQLVCGPQTHWIPCPNRHAKSNDVDHLSVFTISTNSFAYV